MNETLSVEILNQRGLHARASAKIVKCVEAFDASVTLECNGKSAEALSIVDMLMLGAHRGSVVTLAGKGPQAEEAMEAVRELVSDKFGEKQ